MKKLFAYSRVVSLASVFAIALDISARAATRRDDWTRAPSREDAGARVDTARNIAPRRAGESADDTAPRLVACLRLDDARLPVNRARASRCDVRASRIECVTVGSAHVCVLARNF